ncbi:hypothetical protein OSJ78_12545 [Mycobacterium ulcerans]
MGFLVESVTDVHGDGTVTVEAVDVVPGECEHFADAGAGGQQYVEDAQPVIPARGPRFDRPLCHAAILRRISTASSGVGARGLVADRGGVYAGVDGGVAERRYRFDPLCGEFTQSDGPQGWDEQLADYPGVGVERVLGFARPGAVGVGRSSVGPVRVAGRRRLPGQRDMMFVHQRWRTVLCFLDGEASLQCQRCRLCWSDPQNQMRCLSR